jgi:hypothetical protein
VKILFDHCVPKPFRRLLPTHHVRTTAEMGWAALENGTLLAEAAKSFEVLLTVDKNIKSQQNLSMLPLAVLVLDSPRNTPDALAPFAPLVERVLPTLHPGQMVEIDAAGNVQEITPSRPRS